MKRFIVSLTVAAAALVSPVVTSTFAVGQDDDLTIVIPGSSVVQPEDLGSRVHTDIRLVIPRHIEIGPSGAPIAENPASLACIYHLVAPTKGCPKTSTILPTGGTKAIALVDAYDNPGAENDLETFAQAYGYATPNFEKVKVGYPQPNSGWALEESLDIEYSFGMAPNAKIYLVEANSNSFTDLMAAEDEARRLVQAAGGGEISNSWCGGDFQGENQYDSHFKGKGIVYFASAGDVGGQVCYPSASPFVVSAGGTSIERDSNGNFTAEVAGSGAGGGLASMKNVPAIRALLRVL
jgi:kumamolisin